jgi:CelD/BcsL family acetyltransferase involved in cellulose biosynthesis
MTANNSRPDAFLKPDNLHAKRVQRLETMKGAARPTGHSADVLPIDALTSEVRAISSIAAFVTLREAWSALAADADDCRGHMAFDYCEVAAARVLAQGGSVSVAMVFGAGDLLALWPVSIVRSGQLRVAKMLTCGMGEEYGGPLIRAGSGVAVCRAAVSAIKESGADVLDIPWVQNGSALHQALGEAPGSWVLGLLPEQRRGLPAYSVRLRDIPRWEDFFSTLSKSTRDTLRYKRRRFEAQGQTEFGWCQTVSDAVSVLTWLFENKRRWAMSRQLKVPYLMDDKVLDFFIELAHRTELPNVPLVVFAKVNGVPVAASVNLVGSRTIEGLITTYDEAFSACSVGALLTEFLVNWAHANGRDFDFRFLDADYKARWANSQTWHETRLVILRVRGRLIEFSLLRDLFGRAARKFSKASVRLLGRWMRHAQSIL